MNEAETSDAQRAHARCLLTLEDAAVSVRDMVAALPAEQRQNPAVREFDRLQKCARLAVLSGREALGPEVMDAAAAAHHAERPRSYFSSLSCEAGDHSACSGCSGALDSPLCGCSCHGPGVRLPHPCARP